MTEVGTLRYPSSLPTSFLQRRWASAGPEISGPGYCGGWTSGSEVSTRAWWGTPRQKGSPGRAGLPQPERRRTRPLQGVTMTRYFLVSSVRLSFRQPTGSEEGVSPRMTNAQKPGDRLQRSSGRSTRTCMSPPVENPTCAAFGEYEEVPETVLLNVVESNKSWFKRLPLIRL